MANLTQAYQATANINLWFKTRTGDKLLLSDVPSIIPLRWPYFRDNWNYVQTLVLAQADSYSNPDFLRQQVADFTSFIDIQKVQNPNGNPFSGSNVFYKYYAVFDNLYIQAINLSTQETAIVNSLVNTVSNYSKNDFVNLKNTITSYRDYYTGKVGLDDPTYDSTFGVSPTPQQTTATLVDIQYLVNLQNSIMSIDFILSNLFAVDAALDQFALARQNANNPDITINSYSSGKYVRFNYGDSLEDMANQYLGDPNLWLDIAIANGLQPPYIDEIGQAIPFLTNGNGSQINLAQNDSSGNPNFDKFYINQIVFLQSNTQLFPDQRQVTNIRQIPVSGELVITLSGPNNLSNYTLADNANIRVFIPNTVNSNFLILIPSNEPLDNSRQEEVPWFLASSPSDEQQCKVDLAIDDNGELNFTTNGDFQLSYGLTNALQAIKLKVITELGTLRYHPTYGLVNVIGQKNADVNAIITLMTQSLSNMIAQDSRFDRIETLNVQYLVNSQTGQGVAAYGINMTVRLAGGGNTVVPISFTLNN